STWGEDNRWALSTAALSGRANSIFAFHTGLPGGDRSMLAHLTNESGGAVFSVTGKSEVASASRAFRSRPWVISSVAVSGGSDLLLDGAPRTLYPGQTLRLVGRGTPEPGAEVSLVLTQPGRELPEQVTVP